MKKGYHKIRYFVSLWYFIYSRRDPDTEKYKRKLIWIIKENGAKQPSSRELSGYTGKEEKQKKGTEFKNKIQKQNLDRTDIGFAWQARRSALLFPSLLGRLKPKHVKIQWPLNILYFPKIEKETQIAMVRTIESRVCLILV